MSKSLTTKPCKASAEVAGAHARCLPSTPALAGAPHQVRSQLDRRGFFMSTAGAVAAGCAASVNAIAGLPIASVADPIFGVLAAYPQAEAELDGRAVQS